MSKHPLAGMDERMKGSKPTPASPGVDSILDRLNGRDCSKKCWLTHKDDDQHTAKAQLLAHDLALMPQRLDTTNLNKGDTTFAGGFNHAVYLMEQRLREGYDV